MWSALFTTQCGPEKGRSPLRLKAKTLLMFVSTCCFSATVSFNICFALFFCFILKAFRLSPEYMKVLDRGRRFREHVLPQRSACVHLLAKNVAMIFVSFGPPLFCTHLHPDMHVCNTVPPLPTLPPRPKMFYKRFPSRSKTSRFHARLRGNSKCVYEAVVHV